MKGQQFNIIKLIVCRVLEQLCWWIDDLLKPNSNLLHVKELGTFFFFSNSFKLLKVLFAISERTSSLKLNFPEWSGNEMPLDEIHVMSMFPSMNQLK